MLRAAAPRRTQAERSASTARALLDATVASLIELGFAGSSTTEICRRAGVSQGALFKRFASKQDLLAAAARHLYEELLARWLEEFSRLPPRNDRVTAATALLHRIFASPELAAACELTLAARTDRALRRRLEPVIAEHAARLRAQARALFPEAADSERFQRMLDLVLEVMHGMAHSRFVDPDEASRERLLAFVTSLARSAFTPQEERS